jgi:hypothetical protein
MDGGVRVLDRRSLPALVLIAVVLLGVTSVGSNPAFRPSGATGVVGAPAGHASLRAATAGTSFDSYAWQTLQPPAGFPAVRDEVLASDPVDHSVVLFGGCFAGGSCYGGTNATWVGTDGVWTELHPSLSPPARVGGVMAWDPIDGYVLLFGGVYLSTSLNDTWAFRNGTWNPVVPSGPSPPPTGNGALAYDPFDHEMVLFEGGRCSSLTNESSCGTWTYAGGTWTHDPYGPQPAARYGEGLAEDDADDGVLLYGGTNTSDVPLNDTWLFSDGEWAEKSGTAAHPGVSNSVMAWDPSLGSDVLYGVSNSSGGQTWEFVNSTWTAWNGTNAALDTSGDALAWDPTTGNLVLAATGCASCAPVALWGFGPQNAVGVRARGIACGNFTVDGQLLGAEGNLSLENGTYPLRITACHDYLLGNVTGAPLLVLNASTQNLSVWNGSILVKGSGIVFANFTHTASNPLPSGLAAISVFGLTFLELLLLIVAVAVVVASAVALIVATKRRSRQSKGKEPPSAGPMPPR